MTETPPATLRLRLDRDALAANWTLLDRMSGAARAGAAVKADSYGLGARRAVPVLAAAGCEDWFVAHWREAADLLDLVPASRIAVLHGPLTDADCAFARATGLRPVLNSMAQVSRWLEAGGGRCDLMVDTGMTRLGLAPGEISDPLVARLSIDTLHSHLASADEESPRNDAQRAAFAAVCAQVPARRRAIANSAGIALGEGYHFDLTRPGLALYGGVPRGELAGRVAQVAFPEAALIQVRAAAPGDTVGYNATFEVTRPMRVGIVSLGYADGYLRTWSDRGTLRRGEADLPVIGRVSMDMLAVDLAAAPDAREGDWLALDYALPHAAAVSGLSQYELLTSMGSRFLRD